MPLTELNGININYHVQGDGDPLVLIMGFMGTGEGWRLQRPTFAQHYQVITFDNRGVGRSGKPEGDYSTRTMADDAIALMDHLQIGSAGIVGVSLGGMIAQELAINYPERVRKLILVSTMAGREGTSGYSPHLLRAVLGRDSHAEEESHALDIDRAVSAVISLSFSKRRYRWTLVPLALLKFKLSGTRGLSGQAAACNAHYTLDRLHLVQAPTLVVTGTDDHIFPHQCSDIIAGLIPEARLVKLEGGSHTLILEMRKEFNRLVLDYLQIQRMSEAPGLGERLSPDLF